MRIDKDRLIDEEGRHLILRGVNLPAKVPLKLGSSHREVSFVGRPFPLEEAEMHFARLESWGFNCLRLCVSWEGMEHKGVGIYDYEYLDYLEALIVKAERFGFKIFVDFHQDVWSRFTGGDGAPGWTLEWAGFAIEHLEETGAAVLYRPENPKSHVLWATNAYKLAAATLFTLFFGEEVFAPKRERVGGFLQDAYVHMIREVVLRLKGHKAVVGYDIMNEPFAGYIGCKDLNRPFGLLQLGATPTPFEGMVLGDGNRKEISVWEERFFVVRNIGTKELNVGKKRCWQRGVPCIWREAGVWDYNERGEPLLLKPDYFKNYSFEEQFYKPFINRVGKEIHQISSQAIVLIEHVVGDTPPKWGEEDTKNVIFTSHWYDAFLLFTKKFTHFVGYDLFQMKPIIALPQWLRKRFAKQVEHVKKFAKEFMGGIPVMNTEFGIPHDLEAKAAYQTGDFTLHDKALHRSFLAMDDNLISAILWNYTAHNSNDHGDYWNEEDLSIFSTDQTKESLYSGARGEQAFVRPYPIKTAGTPKAMHFHMKKRRFEYHFEHDPEIAHPTEIFVPHLHFGKGVTINLSDGHVEQKGQILRYHHTNKFTKHSITIIAH